MASTSWGYSGRPLHGFSRPAVLTICVLGLVWPHALAASTDLVVSSQPFSLGPSVTTDLATYLGPARIASSALIVLTFPRSPPRTCAWDNLSSIIANDLHISKDDALQSTLLLDAVRSADAMASGGHISGDALQEDELIPSLNYIMDVAILIALIGVFSFWRDMSLSPQLSQLKALAAFDCMTTSVVEVLSRRMTTIYNRIHSFVAHHRIAFAGPYEDRLSALQNELESLRRCQSSLLAEIRRERHKSSSLKSRVVSARSQIAGDAVRLAQAELENVDLRDHLVKLVASYDDTVCGLRKSAKELDACLHTALTNLAAEQQLTAALRNDLITAHDEVAHYSTSLDCAEARVQELEALMEAGSAHEEAAHALRKQVDELQARYVTQRDSSVAALAVVGEEKARVEEELRLISSRLFEKRKELQRAQDQLAEATFSLVELRADNDALRTQLAAETDSHKQELAEFFRQRDQSYALFTLCERNLNSWIVHLQSELQQWRDAYPQLCQPPNSAVTVEGIPVEAESPSNGPTAGADGTAMGSTSCPPSSPPSPSLDEALAAPLQEHSEAINIAALEEGDSSSSGLDDEDQVFDEFTVDDLNVAPMHVARCAFLFQDVPDGFAIVIDAPPTDTGSPIVPAESHEPDPTFLGVYTRYRQWGRRVLRGYDDPAQGGRVWEVWEGTGRGWHRVVSHSRVVFDPVTQMDKSEYIGYTYFNKSDDGQQIWVRDHVPDAEDFARVHPELVARLSALAL